MKISKDRLKQIIKEELANVLQDQEPEMGRKHDLISFIKEHRRHWLPRDWTDEAIEEEPIVAYLELVLAVSSFWNKDVVKQSYTAQEDKLNRALLALGPYVKRAERGTLRRAVSDLEFITPRTRSPSALAATGLGKQVGLADPDDVAAPTAPPEEDDL